jgi:hypothetical protein
VANHFSGQAPLIDHYNAFVGPFDGLRDFHRFGFTPWNFARQGLEECVCHSSFEPPASKAALTPKSVS